MSDIIEHITSALEKKRWSEDQIRELSVSSPLETWKCLLCVNKKALALLIIWGGDNIKDELLYLQTQMKVHSVKVAFVYRHPDTIYLISNLSYKTQIWQIEEFMTPSELLAFIYGNQQTAFPYFILLPRLSAGVLSFIFTFIDGLFKLFQNHQEHLVYYEPIRHNDWFNEDKPLYDYLNEHYVGSSINGLDHYQENDVPAAILVPFQEQQTSVFNSTSNYNEVVDKNRIVLSIDEIKEQKSVYKIISQHIEHYRKIVNKSEYINDTTDEKNHRMQDNTSSCEYDKTTSTYSPTITKDDTPVDLDIDIIPKSEIGYKREYPIYKKVKITDLTMARQTSYQTQIELASDLKRYLHGFQERLAQVAKNYQTKSHELYEAGMMDETHRDFEENYMAETVRHIAGVVDLINDRDIPFVEKYIADMEELQEKYGN